MCGHRDRGRRGEVCSSKLVGVLFSGYDVLYSASKRIRPTLVHASGEKVPSRVTDLLKL